MNNFSSISSSPYTPSSYTEKEYPALYSSYSQGYALLSKKSDLKYPALFDPDYYGSNSQPTSNKVNSAYTLLYANIETSAPNATENIDPIAQSASLNPPLSAPTVTAVDPSRTVSQVQKSEHVKTRLDLAKRISSITSAIFRFNEASYFGKTLHIINSILSYKPLAWI